MTTDIQSPANPKIIYPDSDGQPMADNTKQFRWIVTIQGGLDSLFKDNADVFVAGDLLWYPVEGNNTLCIAPDAMVVFGRPKGDRGSYQQWKEENINPQVVFDVGAGFKPTPTPGNTLTEMAKKLEFYQLYGVEEYYLYDPDRGDLSGWQRTGEQLRVIDPILGWISPRLGVRFKLADGELQLYRPDGQKFVTYVELDRQRNLARQRAEQEAQRAERLAERLRALGVDPEEL